MGEAISLERILAQEPRILVDLSAQSMFSDVEWFHLIRRAYDYADIPLSELEKARKMLSGFSELFSHEHVYTTENVVREMERGYEMVVNSNAVLKRRKDNSSGSRQVNHVSRGVPAIQQGMDSLIQTLRRAKSKARASIVGGIDLMGYAVIETMVTAVSEEAYSKKDYSYRVGGHIGSRTADLHADEELVATAMYLSTLAFEQVSILTADSDIGRIVDHVVRAVIEAEVPGSFTFIGKLKANPVRVYFVQSPGFATLSYDTRDIDPIAIPPLREQVAPEALAKSMRIYAA